MNLDLEKLENSNYYLKKLKEEHLSMMGKNGLEILDLGTTWIGTQKNDTLKCSAHGMSVQRTENWFRRKFTALKSLCKLVYMFQIGDPMGIFLRKK